MSKSKLAIFSIIALLLLSLTISVVAAQDPYPTSETRHVTIDTDGTATVIEAT